MGCFISLRETPCPRKSGTFHGALKTEFVKFWTSKGEQQDVPVFKRRQQTCIRALTQIPEKAPLPLLTTMENTKDETIIKLTEDGKVTKRIIKEGIGMQPSQYSTVTSKWPT